MNRSFALLLCILSATACTTSNSNKSNRGVFTETPLPAVAANTVKLEALAKAEVGLPAEYIDAGVSRQLLVSSEYFSANGRWCRPYTETVHGLDKAGVACNEGSGWVELPLAAFVR